MADLIRGETRPVLSIAYQTSQDDGVRVGAVPARCALAYGATQLVQPVLQVGRSINWNPHTLRLWFRSSPLQSIGLVMIGYVGCTTVGAAMCVVGGIWRRMGESQAGRLLQVGAALACVGVVCWSGNAVCNDVATRFLYAARSISYLAFTVAERAADIFVPLVIFYLATREQEGGLPGAGDPSAGG